MKEREKLKIGRLERPAVQGVVQSRVQMGGLSIPCENDQARLDEKEDWAVDS